MTFKTIATPNFIKELKPLVRKYPSLKKEIEALQTLLEKQPESGTPLGKGCYKIRLSIASKNKGKSGGARVITYVLVNDETVFLISIYDKSDQEDIDDDEIIDLIKRLK